MSKTTKSRHRIPAVALELKSDPIDERYQAEIDRSVARLEARYRKAERALAAAENRVNRARAAKAKSNQIAALQLAVEQRRKELHEIQLLMRPVASGRDSRRRTVRQESGAITIPLGATTGKRPKTQQPPAFPVKTRIYTA